MNKLDKDYCDLLQDILDNGTKKMDRTGTGTISVFGRQIRHKMSDGFPLLTTKKMAWKQVVTELIWFLRGDTNIKYLLDNNCHIWDGDCYKAYEKEWMKENPPFSGPYSDNILSKEEFINKIKIDNDFANKWGDLGPIYGFQWRNWGGSSSDDYIKSLGFNFENSFTSDIRRAFEYGHKQIDQIKNLIDDLKNNPDSRRLMVNAWNVADIPNMTLPPCHFGFQLYTRELSKKEKDDLRLKLILNYLNKKGIITSSFDDFEKDKDRTPNISWRKEVQDIIGWVNYGREGDRDKLKEIYEDIKNIPKRAISLKWNQRSVDTFLGLPFNIASYGLLLEILAKEVNMVPDELIGDLGDTHLYLNHIDVAKEQIGRNLTLYEREDIYVNKYLGSDIGYNYDGDDNLFDAANIPKKTREPYTLPKLDIKLHFKNEPSFTPEHWLVDDFQILNYNSHPTIKAELSN